MKKISLMLISVLILVVSTLSGQENLKIGYINSQEILQQLPMADSIQKVLKKEADEMEKMYNDMINEHDANVKTYEEEKDTYNDFVRNTKGNDLMEAATKIQQFRQNASQQLQKRNAELTQLAYDKINKAIEKIALKYSYTYILDVSSGAVAFFAPSTENLNSLVLDELGIMNH